MRLNKERKLYGGIFVLALGALTVDRFILDGGYGPAQAAAAQGMTASAASAEEPLPGAPVSPAKSGRTLPVAQQVAALQGSHAPCAADAFSLPQRWLTALAAHQQKKTDSQTPAVQGSAAQASDTAPASGISNPEKLRGRKITGVVNVRDKARAFALIDGRRVAIGHTLDGFTLTELTEAGATFADSAGARLELRLPGPDNQPPQD